MAKIKRTASRVGLRVPPGGPGCRLLGGTSWLILNFKKITWGTGNELGLVPSPR